MSVTKKMRLAATALAAPAPAAPAPAAPETALTHITGAAALNELLMRVQSAQDAWTVFDWHAFDPYTRQDVESRFEALMQVVDSERVLIARHQLNRIATACADCLRLAKCTLLYHIGIRSPGR